ncbi:hypothetical protein HZB07_07440 [Candidatus Saganbacteria bacterium]|nr:hypothetical protein [Candidatus Saganbacteria bacterium]
MKHITRFEATKELQKLIGKDLRQLAEEHNITVFKNGKLNKGWAGLTLEKALGIGNNSIQASNGDFWEKNWYKVITGTAVLVGIYATLRK